MKTHARQHQRNTDEPEDRVLFQPDSILRNVGQASVGLLGGGRALLLQLAHPLIAVAVADHSQFQDETYTGWSARLI